MINAEANCVTNDDDLAKEYPFIRSCEAENKEPIKGHVTGEIPKWLRGTLLRNGPGLLHVGQDRYRHVFDGLALLHRFRIENGEVTYQNRFLRSDTYERNMKAQRIVVAEFGTPAYPDPCMNIFQRFASIFHLDFSDNNVINIVELKDELYAVGEIPVLRKIDPKTLETTGKLDLSKYVAVNTSSAHPHREPDGTLYSMGSKFTKCQPTYNIIKIPPKDAGNVTGKGDEVADSSQMAMIVGSIPVQHRLHPSYYHSFGMTENYFVFVEQPYLISVSKMIKSKIFGGAISDCLEWKPDQDVRFYLVRKDNGQIHPIQYKSKAFLFFHQINAYEQDGCIVFDLCAYNDDALVRNFFIKVIETLGKDFKKFTDSYFTSEARRFVLPLRVPEKCGKNDNLVHLDGSRATAYKLGDSEVVVNYETLIEKGPNVVEMPKINYEKHNSKKYRYFYGISKDDVQPLLVKVDTEKRISTPWMDKGMVMGEPIFVGKPDAQSEDDGVILSCSYSEEDETRAILLILDAKSFKELGRATFQTKSSVPGDLHGMFAAST